MPLGVVNSEHMRSTAHGHSDGIPFRLTAEGPGHMGTVMAYSLDSLSKKEEEESIVLGTAKEHPMWLSRGATCVMFSSNLNTAPTTMRSTAVTQMPGQRLT